jgi:hypothetical protein
LNEYLLLKLLHILAFVYWLGGDLGTFVASRQVINPSNSPESRHIALKIMLACDMAPKLAMPLILPLGLHLSYLGNYLPLTAIQLGLIWAASVYWFSVVLVLYANEGKPFTDRLSQLDLYFRIAVAIMLLVWGAYQLTEGAGASWAAWKLLIFAAMVCCGIAIRINLKPFVPAFAAMMTDGASDSSNKAMTRSIDHCRPWVWCIWSGLFLNAALGIRLVG